MPTEPQTDTSIVPKSGMALYIHVPFCQTKCPYCDFNTYQGIEELIAPYLESLTTELVLWGRVLDCPTVSTIFLGGGTPSYLPQGSIGRILDTVQGAFRVKPEAEITAEANPDDLDHEAAAGLLDQGVNRLSIGVQSLNNELLTLLGRRHDANQAIDAYRSVIRAGFSNVNLDLMYGLPRQTMEQWQDTCRQLVSLRPSHISLYCLTLEEGTPLHRWVKQGKLPDPDPDLAADMYQYAEELLAKAGYHHYEISNWTLPGLDSQHNRAYWLNRPYLGVGPGAHSRLGNHRFWNISSPKTYMAQVKQWSENHPRSLAAIDESSLHSVCQVGGQEHINPGLAASETMFLGLRLLDGIDLTEASAQVGTDLAAKYRPQIQELVALDLLEWEDNRLRLTKDTYLIANQVFTRFLQ